MSLYFTVLTSVLGYFKGTLLNFKVCVCVGGGTAPHVSLMGALVSSDWLGTTDNSFLRISKKIMKKLKERSHTIVSQWFVFLKVSSMVLFFLLFLFISLSFRMSGVERHTNSRLFFFYLTAQIIKVYTLKFWLLREKKEIDII